ncbi:MAG: LCP family protein [Clostridiales bacterium]|nr:LCP family protein [Clostridiales bacterium]
MKRTKSTGKKKNSDAFLRISLFLAAFLVFALILAGVVLLYFTFLAPQEETVDPDSSGSVVQVEFDENDRFDFIVAGIDNNTNQLGCVLLLRMDPAGKQISVTPVPTGLTATAGASTATLSALYDYGGVNLLTEGVRNASGVNVTKYVALSTRRVEKLVNTLGAVDVDLTESVHYTSQKEGYTLILQPGRHSLDGLQVLRLLRYPNWEGGQRTQDEMCGRVMCSIINQHLNKGKISSAESLFSTFYNLTDTNIGILDFAGQLPALTYLAQENSGSVAKLTLLPGEYKTGAFTPADNAWNSVQENSDNP